MGKFGWESDLLTYILPEKMGETRWVGKVEEFQETIWMMGEFRLLCEGKREIKKKNILQSSVPMHISGF